MRRQTTQTEQILQYLKGGKAITPLDALNFFGCFRLAARIKDLRDDGYNIVTDEKRIENGATVASYSLAGAA